MKTIIHDQIMVKTILVQITVITIHIQTLDPPKDLIPITTERAPVVQMIAYPIEMNIHRVDSAETTNFVVEITNAYREALNAIIKLIVAMAVTKNLVLRTEMSRTAASCLNNRKVGITN